MLDEEYIPYQLTTRRLQRPRVLLTVLSSAYRFEDGGNISHDPGAS